MRSDKTKPKMCPMLTQGLLGNRVAAGVLVINIKEQDNERMDLTKRLQVNCLQDGCAVWYGGECGLRN